MEKIAANEMARMARVPEVLAYISNKDKAKLRQEAMLKQMDVEMATRRDAVAKRLKFVLQREAQAAKEERPAK